MPKVEYNDTAWPLKLPSADLQWGMAVPAKVDDDEDEQDDEEKKKDEGDEEEDDPTRKKD